MNIRAFAAILLTGIAALGATAATRYVSLSGGNVAPYTSWDSAATNIQFAVDAAEVGDEILVNDGVYETGAQAVNEMSNRVAVTKPVLVRSVNGPALTIIRGYQIPGTLNGPAAVRCAYLTNGAVLTGFTLTNGATQTAGVPPRQDGGGVCCESLSAVVSNCVIAGNAASIRGGGAYSGTLFDCTISSNQVAGQGGGVHSSMLFNCTLTGNSAYIGGGAYAAALNNCYIMGNTGNVGGGGVSSGMLTNCTLTGNSGGNGGGTYSSTLVNCVLKGNNSTNGIHGGGAALGSLYNCTVTGNSTWSHGGGTSFAALYNCIVYYNSATSSPNSSGGSLSHCCTTPLPSGGEGNFTNAPLFLATNGWTNLRLQSSSPCINAGRNAHAVGATDLDGNPRIIGGTVDAGAYEFQSPASLISYAWLQFYVFPIDGSADYLDPDNDRLNNWQEWIAGTTPTDSDSALRMLSVGSTSQGIAVSWSSVTNRVYTLERATNAGLAQPFDLLKPGIAGLDGSTSFTDTGATGPSPFFYRIRVER